MRAGDVVTVEAEVIGGVALSFGEDLYKKDCFVLEAKQGSEKGKKGE